MPVKSINFLWNTERDGVHVAGKSAGNVYHNMLVSIIIDKI